MSRFPFSKLSNIGGITFVAGVVMVGCVATFVRLPGLRGPNVIPFLVYFSLAAGAYILAVARLGRDTTPLVVVWALTVLLRLTLLATTPSTLSDDVYRYIWDGHLIHQGVNPYALAVNSPSLDAYTTPLRELVNNDWMASPYLPVAQLYFVLVSWVSPQNPLAFQMAAMVLDLATGWLVMDILRMLGLPRGRVLIYLWNPLVVIEFAHGAHVDALMITLMMAAFWFIVRAREENPDEGRLRTGSALALAAATLTKGLPGLAAPLFLRRWGWPRVILYGIVLVSMSALFAAGAGWGLSGELDGTGLFGALRIFMRYWNYNSGFYHWLEVLLSGYQTPGAVPADVVGEMPIQLARLITRSILALVALSVGVWAWRLDDPAKNDHATRSLYLMRLALLPLGAYLLLTATVHPWYVTIVVPLVAFLMPREGETDITGRFVWPWLYFSVAVVFSYVTYIDPENLREFYLVRQVEYLPFYLLLGWAAWPSLSRGLTGISERRRR